MENNKTFISVAKKYDKDYLKEFTKERPANEAYVPKYEESVCVEDENNPNSALLCESIEAMVIQSEKRFGKYYYAMMNPVLQYLYDTYHVNPIDLEYIQTIYLRGVLRATAEGKGLIS